MNARSGTVLLGLVFLAGCRSKEDVPYLGRWEGEFAVQSITGKVQIPNPVRNNWKGYIILYRTADGELGNRCQMHLENEQEGVDLSGHWKLSSRQIRVAFNSVKVDDAGGRELADPNKSYLDPKQIHSAFDTVLPLTISKNRSQMQSPPVELGPLLGQYTFTKTALPH